MIFDDFWYLVDYRSIILFVRLFMYDIFFYVFLDYNLFVVVKIGVFGWGLIII